MPWSREKKRVTIYLFITCTDTYTSSSSSIICVGTLLTEYQVVVTHSYSIHVCTSEKDKIKDDYNTWDTFHAKIIHTTS